MRIDSDAQNQTHKGLLPRTPHIKRVILCDHRSNGDMNNPTALRATNSVIVISNLTMENLMQQIPTNQTMQSIYEPSI